MATCAELMEAAKCFDDCIPAGSKQAVLIYLLAQIASLGDQTPEQLLESASCFDCIAEGDRLTVANYLLNIIASG